MRSYVPFDAYISYIDDNKKPLKYRSRSHSRREIYSSVPRPSQRQGRNRCKENTRNGHGRVTVRYRVGHGPLRLCPSLALSPFLSPWAP